MKGSILRATGDFDSVQRGEKMNYVPDLFMQFQVGHMQIYTNSNN